MSHIISAFLAVVAALFPIVNPLGMAPIFMRLTSGCSPTTQAALAWRIAFGGFILMLASMLIGSHILAFFGLTVPAVQVAGGAVVVAAGWRMLQQGDDAKTREQQNKVPDDVVLHRAFFPLTMPLTVGPGTISVAITLGAKGSEAGDLLLPIALGGLLGTLAVAISIYVCYRFGSRVLAVLGEMGTDVVVRLSAFILLCLGVQIMWNGYSALTALGRA
jgi:multiple antibiotic resistance protein